MTSKHTTPDTAGVFGGVDTHKQTHAAAAVDSTGKLAEHEGVPGQPRRLRAASRLARVLRHAYLRRG